MARATARCRYLWAPVAAPNRGSPPKSLTSTFRSPSGRSGVPGSLPEPSKLSVEDGKDFFLSSPRVGPAAFGRPAGEANGRPKDRRLQGGRGRGAASRAEQALPLGLVLGSCRSLNLRIGRGRVLPGISSHRALGPEPLEEAPRRQAGAAFGREPAGGARQRRAADPGLGAGYGGHHGAAQEHHLPDRAKLLHAAINGLNRIARARGAAAAILYSYR